MCTHACFLSFIVVFLQIHFIVWLICWPVCGLTSKIVLFSFPIAAPNDRPTYYSVAVINANDNVNLNNLNSKSVCFPSQSVWCGLVMMYMMYCILWDLSSPGKTKQGEQKLENIASFILYRSYCNTWLACDPAYIYCLYCDFLGGGWVGGGLSQVLWSV